MKILNLGDLHFTKRKPRARTDKDYLSTMVDKLKEALTYAQNNEIEIVLQPGDWFDTAKVSHEVVSKVCSVLEKYRNCLSIFCVAGQHDLHFHNTNNPNIPLNVLKEAGLLYIVPNSSPVQIGNSSCYIYGTSWGQKIPKTTMDGFSILLIHTMVIPNKNEKLWEAQEDYIVGKDLFSYGFDLVVSGDNHNSFFVQNEKGTLINAGSMMRSTVAQIKHRPGFYIFDTDTKEVKKVLYTVKNDTLDLSVKERKEEIDENLNSFISGLKKSMDIGLDYKANIHKALEEHNLSSEVSEVIKNTIETAEI